LENLQDFKLNPPRGTTKQTALIVIADILPSVGADESVNFIVESVMLLPRDGVPKIIASMTKLLYFTAAATQINTRKRAHEWSATFSPAKELKCHTLSSSYGSRAARLQACVNRVTLEVAGQC
jgi:hypothetical protein